MKNKTIVVVGGGYAGVQCLLSLKKQVGDAGSPRLILIDRNPFHLKKVLLFKAAVGETPVRIPFERLRQKGIEFIHASVTGIDHGRQLLELFSADGRITSLAYDALVLAVGGRLAEAPQELGGISLASVEQAEQLKRQLAANMERARQSADQGSRNRLLTVTVVGAGLSGIETSSEIAAWLKSETARFGPDLPAGQVRLVNANDRLLPDAPPHVGKKLERHLKLAGVQVINGAKAERFENGTVYLDRGRTMASEICVWMLGMRANPLAKQWNLPVNGSGKIPVDPHYRVAGWSRVYAIGDCASVIDPQSGIEDGMTCREAVAQGIRLAEVIRADLEGRPAPAHKSALHIFCVSLGPDNGFIWSRKWGLDFIVTGKMGWKIRDYTWKLADLIQ